MTMASLLTIIVAAFGLTEAARPSMQLPHELIRKPLQNGRTVPAKLEDPAGCADVAGSDVFEKQACSIDDFMPMAATVAISLECEFQRTNNLLEMWASFYKEDDMWELSQNSDHVLTLENMETCDTRRRREVCQKDHCMGTRYGRCGNSRVLLLPQPSITGKNYCYKAKWPRHIKDTSELITKQSEVREALRFACVGAGLANFSESGPYLFTPDVHFRMRYLGDDPAVKVDLFLSDEARALANDSEWNPCLGGPLPRNLLSKQIRKRFFQQATNASQPLKRPKNLVYWSWAKQSRQYLATFAEAAAPVYKRSGDSKPVGVVSLSVNMSHLGAVLEKTEMSPGEYSLIVTRKGRVVMIEQAARNNIFMPNMTESEVLNPNNSNACQAGVALAEQPNCWWIPPKPYSLKHAENDSRFSGIKFKDLLDEVFNTNNRECSRGVASSRVYVPRCQCEHFVAHCTFRAVPYWALLILVPQENLTLAASMNLSQLMRHNITDNGCEGCSRPSVEDTLTLNNTGRVSLPFVASASSASIGIEPSEGVLPPGKSIRLQVSVNTTGYASGVLTSALIHVSPNLRIVNGSCFHTSPNAVVSVMIEEPQTWIKWLYQEHGIKLLVALILLVMVLLSRLLAGLLDGIYTKRAEEAASVEQALKAGDSLPHPMILLSSRVFRELKKFVAYEDILDQAVWLHSTEEVDSFLARFKVIFMSHQWTSFSAPDPTGLQYEQMLMAVDTLLRQRNWAEEETFVWLDYSSIPQRHRGLQTLAINSLTVYAAKVSAFVVVAPPVEHEDLKELCNRETYQRRAWCRAEQLSHMLAQTHEQMFLAEGGQLTRLDDLENWLEQSICVFSGDLTCCRRKHVGMEICDRERLVLPMLGFWAQLERRMRRCSQSCTEKDAGFVELYSSLKDKLDDVFPQKFQYETETGVEERPLFGKLMTRLEERLVEEFKHDVASAF